MNSLWMICLWIETNYNVYKQLINYCFINNKPIYWKRVFQFLRKPKKVSSGPKPKFRHPSPYYFFIKKVSFCKKSRGRFFLSGSIPPSFLHASTFKNDFCHFCHTHKKWNPINFDENNCFYTFSSSKNRKWTNSMDPFDLKPFTFCAIWL